MTTQLYVLFEHATGYGLFRVKEYEEVSMFLPQVERASLDGPNFKKLVNLIAYYPFKSGTNALDNINSLSEGLMHEDLHNFLATHFPKSATKKVKNILGVSDQRIAASITEALDIPCTFTDVVPELIRGIRQHLTSLIQGLSQSNVGSAESSLGRTYSRSKVKFNVNRADNMIIQSIALLDQLDKDINTFAMRLREWYSYHFPELVKLVPDNYTYAKVARAIANRKALEDDETIMETLEGIVQDESQAKAILDAAHSSMGMEISEIDLINIQMFTSKVINLSEYRLQLMSYLQSKMHTIAPNLSTLIGESVGARLISHAGSLTNLAKYPASTVQILGAEKALFRALKTRSNTPKYGLLFHSTFIGRAGAKNKGRISRFLANKCSIASRIDCFSENPTDIFGQKLREQVEERLQYYDAGTVPKKNVEVMQEAVAEAEAAIAAARAERKRKKKEKKEKKRKLLEAQQGDVEDGEAMNGVQANGDAVHDGIVEETPEVDGEPPVKKKKKKKSKSLGMEEPVAIEAV